jgi:hypothetical protein
MRFKKSIDRPQTIQGGSEMTEVIWNAVTVAFVLGVMGTVGTGFLKMFGVGARVR